MRRPNLRLLVLGIILAAMSLFVAGCGHPAAANGTLTWVHPVDDYQPENYHQDSPWLPRDLRRVAVLPITAGTANELNGDSLDRLQQVLPGELNRTELFEVVTVSPDKLRRWTGRSHWRITDELPPDLFARLHDQLGCDGVIFAHVTAYHPYPPLAIGWKLHLVDVRQPHVWWSCDLMYDAGDQSVAQSAVKYEREHQLGRLPASDPATILRSPGRFSQYTLAASLETLQRREKNN